MGKEGDGNGHGNPGHNPGYVPLALCAESRRHMETKIDNMQKSIKWSVYLASAGMGIIVILVQYYLAVMLFV